MPQLPETQIEQIAPDVAALVAGRALVLSGKCQNAGRSERACWGEVQGSGKQPYKSRVDLQRLAYKCSCPSRKFPCKHNLALLLLDDVPLAPEPDWVSEWLDARDNAQTNPAAEVKKEKEKTKRSDERLAAVQSGVADMELFLRDLLRTGFLQIPSKEASFFDKAARRLVDAKATGLANWVRNFGKLDFQSGATWQHEALENAVKAWLLIEGFKRLDTLQPDEQEQLKSWIGWSTSKKELADNPAALHVSDHWLVLGKKLEALDDKLNILRTWLYGARSGRSAVTIEYAPAHIKIEASLIPGQVLEAQLAFFPSNAPFRAVIEQQHRVHSEATLPLQPLPDWTAAQEQNAALLAASPWMDDYPQLLGALSLVQAQQHWYLRDPSGAVMPVDTQFDQEKIWQLLAVSGGRPMPYFVLRSKTRVVPLGYFTPQNRYIVME